MLLMMLTMVMTMLTMMNYDDGDLSQSSFFLLPLGVLQRFFPLHSFLPFHLSTSHDDGGNNIYNIDDDNQNQAMTAMMMET